MFFLNLIADFYSGLSGNSFFFFWVIVFVIIVLFGLIGILMIKNNKLTKLLKEVNKKLKEEELNNKDEVISTSIDNSYENDTRVDTNTRYVANRNNSETIEEKDLYQKNVLRDTSKYTSPINITKEESDFPSENLREDSTNPLEDMEDLDVVSDKIKETEKIMSSLESASKPSTVELTDYEKKQEEEAIISYNELQKVKDKIYDTEESEEVDNIDELKSFNIDIK